MSRNRIIGVGDLVSKDRLFLKSEKLQKVNVAPNLLFVLMGILDSLPSKWRSVIKGNFFHEAYQFDENCIKLRINGELVALTSTTSKLLYKEFFSHKTIPLLLKPDLMINIQTFRLTGRKSIP